MGKKLIVYPHKSYITIDKGAYAALVWEGKGRFGGYFVEAKNFGFDELLISHERSIKPLKIENTSEKELKIFKFFGPDINLDVPMLPLYKQE